jgi:hypothetical protein
LKNVLFLTPFEKIMPPIAPFFDLVVDFHVFYEQNMGFWGHSSRFGVTVLIKSVTLLEVSSYKYLGIDIQHKLNCNYRIEKRISGGWKY